MKVNVYIPDDEHANLQLAQAKMKAAGTSLSAVILKLLKTHTAFWPTAKPRAARKGSN